METIPALSAMLQGPSLAQAILDRLRVRDAQEEVSAYGDEEL